MPYTLPKQPKRVLKTIGFSGSFHWFCLKTKDVFFKRCSGFLESDMPLNDLRDTLGKTFKITYILEGVSLKLWWMGNVTEKKPNEVNLTPSSLTLSIARNFCCPIMIWTCKVWKIRKGICGK